MASLRPSLLLGIVLSLLCAVYTVLRPCSSLSLPQRSVGIARTRALAINGKVIDRRRNFFRGALSSVLLSGMHPSSSSAASESPQPGGPGISDEYIAELKRRKEERCKFRGGCPDSGRIFMERGYVEYFHTLNKEIVRNLDGSYEIITMKEARQLKREGKLRSEKVGWLPFGDAEILVKVE
eukprot:jgi/Bigna1/63849/fgenesh1_kg.61_\